MNAPLFLRVNARILAEPAKVYMNWMWNKLSKGKKAGAGDYYGELDCDTVGCYCGHTIAEARPSLFRRQFGNFEMAAKLLDIPSKEAEMLFTFHDRYTDYQPYVDLGNKLFRKKPGTLAYARIVVQAARRCMKRNKNEHYDGYLKDSTTVTERPVR